jgi:predicted transcriptional regulator
MKTVCIRITHEFDHRLRVVAAHLDLNRSELIRQALEDRLVQYDDDGITRYLAPALGSGDILLDRSVPLPIGDSASPTVE